MRIVEGVLEAYGDYMFDKSGKTTYKYIRIRRDDGKVENIQNISCFPNVDSQIRVSLGERVKLGFSWIIYFIESNEEFHSDIMRIRATNILLITLMIATPLIYYAIFQNAFNEMKLIVGLTTPLAAFLWLKAFVAMFKHFIPVRASILQGRARRERKLSAR